MSTSVPPSFLSATMGQNMHLTGFEKKIFDGLPADIRKQFENRIETESIHAYETEKQLRQRLCSASFTKDPRAHLFTEKILHKMLHGEGLENVSLDEMPEALLNSVLFGMGATGIAALIEVMLPDCNDSDGMEAVAALSRARHRILVSNVSTLS